MSNDLVGSQNAPTVAWLIAGHEGGGVARALFNLAGELRRRKWRITVVSMRDGDLTRECQARGYETFVLGIDPPPQLAGSIGRRTVNYLKLLRVDRHARKPLAGLLRRERVELLHVSLPTLVRLSGVASRAVGIPCVWEMANLVGRRTPFRLNQRIYQHICARYGIVPLANSAYTASTLGSNRVRAKVIHLAADPERFNPDSIQPVTRRELGVPEHAIVVGMIARLISDKGQAEVLQAIMQLLDHEPRLHLLLIGGSKTLEFGETLTAIAQVAGASDRLHMMGAVSDPERYYDVIDIAVNNYRKAESFGLSVVEAMLMGCPVLVHALGGPAETVIDGETGWHVADPSAESIRAGLQRVLDDRPRWAEMGRQARRHALAHFTTANQADRYVAIIHELMKSRIADTRLT